MATNTLSSNFAADVSTYIAKATLMLAVKMVALYPLMDKAQLPKNEGRTFQYTRYDRVALPQSALSEGVTPGDSSMSISTVSAVMDQWGAIIPISDVAIDSVAHPVLQQAIELAGLQAAETVDREIAKVLLTGTNVFFPGAVSARSGLASTDKVSSALVGKAVANLKTQGAQTYDGRHYVGVLHPMAAEDMMNDTLFVGVASYQAGGKLYNNEIGTWKGVRWIESNVLPSISLAVGASGTGSATGGSLTASTTYNAKLVVVDALTGYETFSTAVFNAATGMGQSSVDITVPALPAGATANSKFRLYFGSNGGTLYLAASDIAASSTYNQKTVPTSGAVAPAAPASGFRTYMSFVFGKQGAGCVELNKIKSYLTPAVASDSDPLVQRRKVGWKCDFKAVIKNDLFLARLEHATTNGG
jgi:N4-gp56 family major capsid protein